MAMIKCPECGREISDRAPSCPSCGVKIENEVIKCPVCGDVYFKEQAECPHCHHRATNDLNTEQEHAQNTMPSTPPASSANPVQGNTPQQPYNNASTCPTENANVGQPQQNAGESTQNAQSQPNQPAYNAYQTQAVQPAQQQQNGYQGQPAQPSQQQNAYQGQSTAQPTSGVQPQSGGAQQPPYGQVPPQTPPPTTAKPHNKNITTIILIVVIGFLLIGFGVYVFSGSPEHIDKISQQLAQLKQADQDWTNTMVSGSKSALAEYLNKYPNSIHKGEAERKIDSLDWVAAKSANTTEAYNLYITEHPNGDHIDEANNSLNVAKAKNITPKEKEMLALVFRSMFRSINDRDDEALTSNFSDFLSSFLGKGNASKSDVIAFLNKIYKDDITAMEWRANNDMKISKREIGIDEYEYTVDFSAKQKIEREDDDKETEANYRIKAKVNPDGKITELNMVKVLQ